MLAWYMSLIAGCLAFILTCWAGFLHHIAFWTTVERAGLVAITSGVLSYGAWVMVNNYFQHTAVRVNKLGQKIDIKIDSGGAAQEKHTKAPSAAKNDSYDRAKVRPG